MQLQLGTFMDKLLGGFLQKDTITTIYGPPGSGKTTLCLEYCSKVLENEKKVFFIDTEGGFSAERLKQINPTQNLENLTLFSPKTFEEQQKVILNLTKQIKNSKSIGLIVVDSLVMLYRLKLGDAPQKINKELGEQLRMLTEISRNYNIPILVINQMYTSFDTKENKMVGGMLIEYWSKTIVELNKDHDDYKRAILKKHKSKKEGENYLYEIKASGLREINFD